MAAPIQTNEDYRKRYTDPGGGYHPPTMKYDDKGNPVPFGPDTSRIDVAGIYDQAREGADRIAEETRRQGTTAIQRARESSERQTRDALAGIGGYGRGGVVQQAFNAIDIATIDAQRSLEQGIALDVLRQNFEIDKEVALRQYEDELRIANWSEQDRRVARDLANAFLTMQYEAELQMKMMEFQYDLENEWSWGDLAGQVLGFAATGFNAWSAFQTGKYFLNKA